jgi:hypothetical protein
MSTRCLKKNLQPHISQTRRQDLQRIEQWLSARNYDSLRSARLGTLDHLVNINGRENLRIPGIFGIAPSATHIAPAQADEIGRLTRMKSLTLNGIEVLNQWQTVAAIQHITIRQ